MQSYEHLDKQLSNGNNFVRCYNCNKEFYPSYRRRFCSNECIKTAFESISKSNNSDKIDYVTVLEILSASPDETTEKISKRADCIKI